MFTGHQVCSCHEESGGISHSIHGEGEGGDDGTFSVSERLGQSHQPTTLMLQHSQIQSSMQSARSIATSVTVMQQ